MKRPKIQRWLAGAVALLTGITAAAFSPGSPGFSKPAPIGLTNERPKETHMARKTSQFPTVPTLKGTEGRLKPIPRIGSRSLVESKPAYAPANITSSEAGRIYGGVIFAHTWTEAYQPVGIYSFPISDGSDLREEAIGSDYVVSGGVYADGQYHFISYMSFMGMAFANLYSADVDTWTITRALPVKTGAIPQDMAYDPTTGNAYGCFMNDNADGWVLGALNLETGERRLLKDLDLIILSVGVNSKGEWYGVGLDGNFYRFDKETGDRTLIGSTGRHPMYSASGCFDLQTDRFYWECIESDSKAILYEIDVKTGKATKVTDIKDNAEIVGMYIPVPEAEDAAPAPVSDLAFNFPEGSLEGFVEFTMPSMQFDGKSPLSGSFTWNVAINEKEHASGTAMPGEKVSVPAKVDAPGFYRANVSTTNAAGRSPITMIEDWLGHDMPGAVTNINLVPGEGPTDVVLTWEVPTETINGGFVDTDAITYNIVRYPDEVTVATGQKETRFAETLPEPKQLTLYSYAITPVYQGAEGYTSVSATLPVGSAVPPMYNYLSQPSDLSFFQIIDANGDGETWTYDEIHAAARIKYSFIREGETVRTCPMDDWMVTPRVQLKAGRMYRFALDAGCYFSYMPERLEVKMGTTATPEGLNMTVIPVTTVNFTDMTTLEGWIQVETDGVYFFGIHAMSQADTMYLYVNNVAIEEGPLLGSPGKITSLTAKAAEKGELKATLSGIAPSVTVDDKPLEEITEIRIVRDGRPIGSIKDVQPGKKFEYVDESAVQSDNTYVLTAVNSIGEGYEATTSVYVGHDRPGLPRNVHAEYTGKTSVKITWDAPSESETGGYFDPSALTYTVLRANDEKELATGLTELSFTDPNAPLNGYRQEFYGYYVYAQSPAGYGYGQLSNIVCVGEPYPMPFIETFANGKITNDPWDVSIPEESGGYWQLKLAGEYPDVESQDPEGGIVTFIPEESGDEATLTSGTISLKDAQNPVVEFWWYFLPGSYDTIKLLLSKNGGEFTEIGEARASNEPGEEGWHKKTVALENIEGVDFIQIAFEARSGTGYNNIHIDNIRVKNVFDHNLAALNVQSAARMKMGEEAPVTVNIENSGLLAAEDYVVNLYADDQLVATAPGPRIEPDTFAEIQFNVTPQITWSTNTYLNAAVEYEKDMYSADNATYYTEVRIIAPNFPAVNDLEGTLDGNGLASLTWSEPELIEGDGQTVTDGAEDYQAFAISDFGDWWTIDVDGLPTFGIQNNMGGVVQYPNTGRPQAFMVFNPSQAGIPTEYSDGTPTDWAPRTGDQFFASFGSEEQSDNWLISPELPGVAQTISFYVKSQTAADGYEKFEVYYSTTGIAVSDFIRLGDLRSAPTSWTEERVDLPQGARYFAIRCVSKNAFVFMVDDITYLPAAAITEELSLIGYNVYRDGECITPKPIMEMTFTDSMADGKRHTYGVSTVYDKGESKLSNTVRLAPSGVEETLADGVGVQAGRGFIKVEAPAGNAILVNDAEGRTVAKAIATGADLFHLPAGIYVVVTSGKSVKTIVR